MTSDCLPWRPKGSAVEEDLPDLKGEEKRVVDSEGIAPLWERAAGQHQGLVDLLDQLVQ